MYQEMMIDLDEDIEDIVKDITDLCYNGRIERPYDLLLFHSIASIREKFIDFTNYIKEEYKE